MTVVESTAALRNAYARSLAGIPVITSAGPALYETANGPESYALAMSATSAQLAEFEATTEFQDYVASGANPETGQPGVATAPVTSPALDTSSPAAYLASEDAAVLGPGGALGLSSSPAPGGTGITIETPAAPPAAPLPIEVAPF